MPAELRRRVEAQWRLGVLQDPPSDWRGGARALTKRSASHLAVVYLHHHPRSPAGEQHFTIQGAVLSRVLAEYKGDRLTVEPLAGSGRWSWHESAWRLNSAYETWFGFDAARDDPATARALRDIVIADMLPAAETHMDDQRLLAERWDEGMINARYLPNLEPGIPFAGNWPTWVEAAVLASSAGRIDIYRRVVAGLESVADDSRVAGPGYVREAVERLLRLATAAERG